MKKLLFLGACLVALASPPVLAQTGKPDIVVVKVGEFKDAMRIVIVRSDGKTEVIDLAAGAEPAAMTQSAKRVQQILTQLYAQGYILKSTFSGYQGQMSTLVLVKGK